MITKSQKAYFILAHSASTHGLTADFWEQFGRYSDDFGVSASEFAIIAAMEQKQIERLLNAMLGAFFNPRCDQKDGHREVEFLPEIHSSVCAYCGYRFETELKMGDLASEHKFPTKKKKR
jgi:hypothetical protein